MTHASQEKFFFVHVMKTGGTSFADIVKLNFSRQERYPDSCLEDDADFGRRSESYLHVPSIVADVNANITDLRMVAGHIPYATRYLFREKFTTLTLLRHPVERTISYLKHCRQYHPEHAESSFEELYELPWFRAMFIDNYQTKIFSMTADEALAELKSSADPFPLPALNVLKTAKTRSPEVERFRLANPARFILEVFAAGTGSIEIDEGRLKSAMSNLRETDVVGVTEHYGRFMQKLVDHHGWRVNELPRKNTGSKESITPDFARRIADDCSADMALYDLALTLAT